MSNGQTKRKCAGCEIQKPLDEFPRHKGRPLGRAYECKVCMRARVIAWAKTPRGAAMARKNKAKYRRTEKGRRKGAEYNRLPRVRAAASARRKARRHTQEYQYAAFNQLLRRYGMDVEGWARLFNEQGCRCACCNVDLSTLRDRDIHVDHCHKSGKVRGILCRACNNTVGHSKEDTDRLLSAATYVRKHAAY